MNVLSGAFIFTGIVICLGCESPYLTNMELLGQGLSGVVLMAIGVRLLKKGY